MSLHLVRQGVPVICIEREPEVQKDLRASTFHPPTLEMLDELDLASDLIDCGLVTNSWQIRLHETHEKAEFDLQAIRSDTRYPFRLQSEQRELCRLAVSRTENEPLLELRWAAELVDIVQHDDFVRATIRTPVGELELDASWLIGCDGGSSSVRSILNVELEGSTYPETIILATTTFPFEKRLPGLSNVNYVWSDQGTFSLLRLPNVWRCSLYVDPDESVQTATDPVSIEEKLQRIVPKSEPYEVREIRPYRIHQRIVSDYRLGRVLLAGDAAHLNSPSGGMGMNAGIHDAFSLAEKLVAIINLGEPESLLDQYSRQRRAVAHDQVLKQAHRNRTRMQQRDPHWRREELKRLQNIASDPVKCREFLLESSMISGLAQACKVA
jgi:3-(3-hydroxy-phenyl)propionate hydroxylase